jgi:hypothetical protein
VAEREGCADGEEESGDTAFGVRVGLEEIGDRRVDSERVQEGEHQKPEGSELEPALAGPIGQSDERGGCSCPHESEPRPRDKI